MPSKIKTARRKAGKTKAKRVWKPRPSSTARGYDEDWKRCRRAFMAANPLCAECAKYGRVKPGQCVDHIQPLADGGARLDFDNLQTLCHSCHSKKTIAENPPHLIRERE